MKLQINIKELARFEGNEILNLTVSQQEMERLIDETVGSAIKAVGVYCNNPSGGQHMPKIKRKKDKANSKHKIPVSSPKFDPIEAEEQEIVSNYQNFLITPSSGSYYFPRLPNGASILHPVSDKSIKKDPQLMSPSENLMKYLRSVETHIPGKPDLKPYNDSRGYATIGYGHLIHGRSPVTKDDTSKYKGYTEEQAEKDFESDLLEKAVKPVRRNVNVKLTQSQFDALVDFAYNSGLGNFWKSKLRDSVNNGETDPQTISKYFHQYNIVPWRKEDEANMFNFGFYDVKK